MFKILCIKKLIILHVIHYYSYNQLMTSKVDVTTYFSDSEEENEEESKEVVDDNKIVNNVKKTRKERKWNLSYCVTVGW